MFGWFYPPFFCQRPSAEFRRNVLKKGEKWRLMSRKFSLVVGARTLYCTVRLERTFWVTARCLKTRPSDPLSLAYDCLAHDVCACMCDWLFMDAYEQHVVQLSLSCSRTSYFRIWLPNFRLIRLGSPRMNMPDRYRRLIPKGQATDTRKMFQSQKNHLQYQASLLLEMHWYRHNRLSYYTHP